MHRDAWRRFAWYAAGFAVAAILLALLPGGRHGTTATVVVVVLASPLLLADLVGYVRLRRVEDEPFMGSRRAGKLLLVLVVLPVFVVLALLELTSGDGIAIGAALACLGVWLVVGPLIVISERRRAAKEGWAVWPAASETE